MSDPRYGLWKLTPSGAAGGYYCLCWIMTMMTIKKKTFPSHECKWIFRINYIKMNELAIIL